VFKSAVAEFILNISYPNPVLQTITPCSSVQGLYRNVQCIILRRLGSELTGKTVP